MGAKVKWRKDREAWFLYVYANGTQAVKRFGPTLADKRRAERRAKEVNAAQLEGKIGLEKKANAVPFEEFANEWLRRKVLLPIERRLEGHLAPKTAKLREQMIRLHLVPFLGRRDIRKFNVPLIDDLWEHLLKEKLPRDDRHLSRRTLDIVLGTLRLILADAVAKEIIPANVIDQWKDVQPRGRGSSKLKPVDPRKVLDGGEREHFLETAKRVSPDHYAFILTMAETGCRISEAAKLTWGDLDIDLGVARIYRQKTGGQATDVELSARLRQALRERLTLRLRESLRQGRRDGDPLQGLVFANERGGEMHLENFRRRVFNKVVEKAFPEGRPLTPHSLRHTWASLHMARGTPLKWIQDQGGWASAAMLLGVYSHFLPRETSGYSDVLSRQDRTTPDQAEAGSPGR